MEEVLGFLAWLFFEVLLIWTGETIKFLVTFGRYKPTYRNVDLNVSSSIIGGLFWVGVIALAITMWS